MAKLSAARLCAAAALLYTTIILTVRGPNLELLDLVPATLLALIITAVFTTGFTLGAAALITMRIILPTRKKHP